MMLLKFLSFLGQYVETLVDYGHITDFCYSKG